MKKKATENKELEELKSKLEAKETEVKGLQTKIDEMENPDPLSKKAYYTFYRDLKRDVLAFMEKPQPEIKETNWRSFVDGITMDHDIDLSFFLMFACIDLFQVPFSSYNAKKYYCVSVLLADIIRYSQG